jgi:hypothetical protein
MRGVERDSAIVSEMCCAACRTVAVSAAIYRPLRVLVSSASDMCVDDVPVAINPAECCMELASVSGRRVKCHTSTRG